MSADGEQTYLIGVEFVSAQPALLRADRSLAGRMATGEGGGSVDAMSAWIHGPSVGKRRASQIDGGVECRLGAADPRAAARHQRQRRAAGRGVGVAGWRARAVAIGPRRERRFARTCRCGATSACRSGIPLNGLGAMFTAMDERSRRSLEDFLRKASQ